MTCPLINTDRAQLLRLDAVAASTPSPRSASVPATDSTAPASSPAQSIAPTQAGGTLRDTVIRHCAKMPHPNGEARNRSIALHLLLASKDGEA